MTSAAMLQRKLLRLRPMHASQCGSHLSENVRFTLPVSVAAVSAGISFESAGVVFGRLSLKRDFLGVGASHAGVSWIFSSVAIEGR